MLKYLLLSRERFIIKIEVTHQCGPFAGFGVGYMRLGDGVPVGLNSWPESISKERHIYL